MTSVTLAERDRRFAIAHLERILSWDPLSSVRVQVTRDALGIFAAPPLGVVTFIAVPAAADGDDIDDVVSALVLRERLLSGETADLALDPTICSDLGLLPPRDGWQLPIPALSGDLLPMVDAAVAEYRTRTAGAPPLIQQTTADEIWSRIAWAGLPLRVLHAAALMGFLTRDASRVAAATSGPWKRLTTSRGQVFVHATGAQARIGLGVIR